MGAAGLNLGRWVDIRHFSFGELDRARRTTRQFTEVPHITFNFMLNLMFASVTFGEKLEVPECTWRLTESPSSSPFACAPIHVCFVTFGGLILARRILLAIRWKAFPSPICQIFWDFWPNPFGKPDLAGQRDLATRRLVQRVYLQLFLCASDWIVFNSFMMVCRYGKDKHRHATP